LLVSGEVGQSQTTHICPAILSELEKYPVHSLDLPSLLADAACRSLEEACVQTFREATRVSPSVLYLPRVDAWWGIVGPAVQTTIALLLGDMMPTSELFVLATSDVEWDELPASVQTLFVRCSSFLKSVCFCNHSESLVAQKVYVAFKLDRPPPPPPCLPPPPPPSPI
jgi:SpoVK/Ycf46/Vps4 family AAA+-type ATPase